MKKILFFCKGNSSRGQMAEGFARKHLGNKLQIYSAGSESYGVNSYTVEAMKLLDVDIEGQYSKPIQDFPPMTFDYVLTLCDEAPQVRPFFPGAEYIHYGFKDPQELAKLQTTETDKLRCFVQVACDIEKFIKSLPELFPHFFAK